MRRPIDLLSAVVTGVFALVAMLAAPSPLWAQYSGHNFKGDFGVNSGSQPLPGVYVLLPYGQWNADEIKDEDGNRLASTRFQGFDLRAIPPIVIGITKTKILGANYGFIVAVPFTTIKPERVDEDAQDNEWGLSDLYVVPLQLGWHRPRVDVVAGYGLYIPTGRYEPGANDNVGLGMWSHEIQGGATVYLDAARKVTLATMAFAEIHSKKEDQDLKVGNLLTLEGGAAYNVPKLGGAFGIAYFAQKKLTEDSGSDVPELLLRALKLRGKNSSFGIGPDVTVGLFQRGTTAGLLNVRYLWESSARSSFEGSTFFMSITIAKLHP